MTTALGREVPIEDWTSLHRDTILKVLYEYRMSAFNPNDEPLALTALCNATGLSPADTTGLCEQLRQQGLVDAVPDGRYRVTDAGVGLVRNAPGRLPFTGSIG